MAKDIQHFRLQLVEKIKLANSRVQAILMIDAAIKTLMEKNIHGYTIVRFMEKLNSEIDDLRDKAQDEMQKIFETASTRVRFLRERLFISGNPSTQ